MALEFHNRKKNAAAGPTPCEQLVERWGSIERIAGSVSATGGSGRARPDGRLIAVGILGIAMAVGVACLVPLLSSSRSAAPKGDRVPRQAPGGSTSPGGDEEQTQTDV